MKLTALNHHRQRLSSPQQVSQPVVPPSPLGSARLPAQSEQDLDAKLALLRSQLEQVCQCSYPGSAN